MSETDHLSGGLDGFGQKQTAHRSPWPFLITVLDNLNSIQNTISLWECQPLWDRLEEWGSPKSP